MTRTMNSKLIASIALTALLAQGVSAQDGIDRPLMGWSSWNTYHVNINEELIKRQADALVGQGLKDAGYRYINIDDGFFGYRDEQGKMHPHPERFPNGMKVVSDYIHSLGLRAGIYSDAGDNTCGSIYDNDINGVGSGLYGHEQQDMDLYLKEWNYDFIKIDYCGSRELGLDEEKRYRTICEAIGQKGRLHQYLPLGLPRHLGKRVGPFVAHQQRHSAALEFSEIHHREEPLSVGIRRRRAL